jgi:hypothetical protein
VTELEAPVVARDEAGLLGGLERAQVEAECRERAGQGVELARVARRGDEERLGARRRQRLDLPEERARHRRRGRQLRAERLGPGELARRQRRRHLDQHERVPGRGLDDPLRDGRVERRGRPAREQLAGVALAECRERQLGQVGAVEHRLVAVRDGEDERDAVGVEAAGGEEERLGRGEVEPLGVVDDDERRRLLGNRREQAERGGADREAVAGGRRPDRERACERAPLRLRQVVEAVEHRPEELREPGEGKLGLGLDAARREHGHPPGLVDGVRAERALANPGLAPEDEGRARPGAGLVEQPPQPFALAVPPEEHGRSSHSRVAGGRLAPTSAGTVAAVKLSSVVTELGRHAEP